MLKEILTPNHHYHHHHHHHHHHHSQYLDTHLVSKGFVQFFNTCRRYSFVIILLHSIDVVIKMPLFFYIIKAKRKEAYAIINSDEK